ncbi:Bug family tripartite tricarboxylate transporter substrate binding protein [Piscinibacter koreensis]|uniref:Tripartite tricarboxylate transporter substrate binding protein n=1 Tax=Piscinibacter koreensis TaxID=2742824 RepID=A0A7Y6TYK5_9BURK|nr:tripartite tricarboxylate transporter substrate binding protein [Schlegelella koreensis]NUZ08343.1 tripartite tricarboxylate transporter substrate binding protein [Schlegelella koreensis]
MHARRILLKTLAAAAVLPSVAFAAYPERPIEWVVPYPAGGGTDVVARTLAEPMGKTLGQTIIINNKPGAGTNIGADYAAKAKADGYVLLSADTATLAANPFLYTKLTYNVEKDFAPVGLMARFPLILVVNPNVPVKNLAEFTAWAKQQQAGVSYGTPGAGSPHHLATELFRERTGVPLVHVPYRGAAPAVQDVLGGQIPMMFVDTASGYAHIQSGKLRPIGVASPKRVAGFDNIPTLAEQGLKGFEAYAWQGLVVPAGTPQDVIAKLSTAMLDALRSTPVKARFQTLGLEAIPSTPAEMAAYARSEREKWGRVIKASNIRLD